MKNTITIIRPGGNDTALIEGIVSVEKRKNINAQIMAKFPNVEQVGFYDYDKTANIAILEMAGGEFCGNAVRSLAYLLLGKANGELTVQSSGSNQLVNAG